ncbi:hypothetical protein IEQ34_016320 [Dendrobium chrysotoxum]|uniref:Protein kinase domain-containing protein n=1 Tax=Dendrobium chrysotoxum TaxID=161865 RepID=A0AAV7GD54_DENCH|nr:hypothetical protein IEQ34_016320 [Dendrobium chrysotoxum]
MDIEISHVFSVLPCAETVDYPHSFVSSVCSAFLPRANTHGPLRLLCLKPRRTVPRRKLASPPLANSRTTLLQPSVLGTSKLILAHVLQMLNTQINKKYHFHIFKDIKVNQFDALHFVVINDIKHIQIIKNCDLDELRELGFGTIGAMYHGKWRGSFVAIKRIHDIYFAGISWIQERARADFWNEIFMLANLHHPNIITFYDIVWDGSRGSFVAITEYMVDSLVRSGIINSSEYVGDLGNLGLSKVKYSTLISYSSTRGTISWMTPELLSGRRDLVF